MRLRMTGKIKNILHRTRYILMSSMLAAVTLMPLAVSPSLASASPTINEYPLNSGHAGPTAMVAAGGLMWYLNSTTSLSSISPSGVSTDYSILPTGETGANLNVQRNALAADASGNVWFAGCDYNSTPGVMLYGYVNAYTGMQATFKNTSELCAFSINTVAIGQPVVDAAGNIWIDMLSSYTHASSLAQFNASGVQISGWSLTGGTQQWKSIVAGPNNSLWAVDSHNNKIDQLTLSPTTDKVTGMTAYSPSSVPVNISTGPDGNLWFTESGNAIASMTPTGTFIYHSLAVGSHADYLGTGPDGALWFTDTTTNSVGRITTAGSVTEYALPSSGANPLGIAAGLDNALWFSESTGGKIGRISAAPFINEYPLNSGHAGPTAIVAAGGATWYLNSTTSLSSISTSGASTDYSILPTGETGTNISIQHNALTADASGNVWYAGCDYNLTPAVMLYGYVNAYTGAQATFKDTGVVCDYSIVVNSIGQPVVDAAGNIWIDTWNSYTKASAVREYNAAGVSLGGWSLTGGTQHWTSIVAGPNNSLWAVDSHNNKIDQLTLSPTTDKVTGMTAYSPSSVPVNISTGPDGNLWFTESGNAIASMTPTGVFTYFGLPSGSQADYLTNGPDNAVWFTDSTTNSVGRISIAGNVTEYPITTTSASPMGITMGPDNALWFTESAMSKIGRVGY